MLRVIGVSKKHNSVWRVYYHDYNDDDKICLFTKKINPLLIWYYKLRKRHRVKGVCPECHREFLCLTNWHDKKLECPFCMPQEQLLDEEDYDEF